MTAPPSVMIRPATAADSEGILACLLAAFEPYRSSYTPDAFLDTVLTPDALLRRLRTMHLLVAIDADGAVVGTIGHALVGKDLGHIRGMAVLPGLQGTGVARRLLAAAEEG